MLTFKNPFTCNLARFSALLNLNSVICRSEAIIILKTYMEKDYEQAIFIRSFGSGISPDIIFPLPHPWNPPLLRSSLSVLSPSQPQLVPKVSPQGGGKTRETLVTRLSPSSVK